MPTSYTRVKQLLFGRPLPSERLDHERLNKKTALAVLSSDAISSVAYATEQILLVLAVLSTAALGYVLPISAVIVGLLILVALSYRQTVFAYPSGGGSYTVAKDNLGAMPGLVAAAALLTDYILTVAVSISSGIAAITSAYASLAPHTVLLCTVSIVVLMLVNLRGVRESGVVFSVPTYVFIALMLLLIVVGIAKLMGTHVVAGEQRSTSDRSALGTAARHRLARWIRVHLPDLARVRRRMRGHDGNGGDLQRRRRVSTPKLEERGNDPRMDGRDSRGVLHRHELARERIQRHADDDGDRPLAAQPADLRFGRALLRAPVCDLSRSSSSRRIPHSPTSRDCRAFSRTIGTCHASSRPVGIGSHSRTESWCSRSSRFS
jgi:hypothetical protein